MSFKLENALAWAEKLTSALNILVPAIRKAHSIIIEKQ